MDIIYIALLTILASTVGTLSGFGTSTIMVPILLFFLPLPETLLLVGIIHWFGDIWKMVLFRTGFRWRLILTFGIPGIVATYIGANMVFSVPDQVLSQVLGGFLLAYVVFLIFKPSFKVPANPFAAGTGGLLSGFFAGIFGVGGAVRGLFLTAFNLDKSVYLVTAGAIAFIIDSTRITTYLLNGQMLEQRLLYGFVLFVPASLLGAAVAKKFVDRIPQANFRMVVAAFLFLVGLKFLLWPV